MSNHVEPQTKTVVISWVEESRHQTVVPARALLIADAAHQSHQLP